MLGQYFHTESYAALDPRMIPVLSFEIWLVSSFAAYMIGLLTKRLRPNVADGILMWIIKPILLLASILYITLGVYINMYVFEFVKKYALLGALLLPLCGFLVGGATAAICRQPSAFVKTIALETSNVNCLVVLAALRFSLQQPNADLAAMIPIWVMFTVPGIFVILAAVNKIRKTVLYYWRNRNGSGGGDGGNKNNNNNDDDSDGCIGGGRKDPELLLGGSSGSKAYSVSSSMVGPPGCTTLSAPLVVSDGADDDLTISTTSNQRVTVL